MAYPRTDEEVMALRALHSLPSQEAQLTAAYLEGMLDAMAVVRAGNLENLQAFVDAECTWLQERFWDEVAGVWHPYPQKRAR